MADFGVGSDYKTLISFKNVHGATIDAGGVGMPASFELLFYVGSENVGKIASYSEGVYTNCGLDTVSPRKLWVAFDNVQWQEGEVICKASLFFNDLDFLDDKRTVVSYIETGDSYVRL